MGPSDLEQVLLPLKKYTHPNLIVGLEVSDDAAVYRMNAEQAIIQTVDFFPPVVDDPYIYGAVAAANAMSDVYAMGGEVLLGINIVAFPDNLPHNILSRILQGGADKMAEVGAIVAGGHTVVDKEPKYGICVTGVIHPDKVLTKAAAKAGDVLYLTKPLGTGVITTAHKRDVVDKADLDAACTSMLKLNRRAAQLAQQVGVHACTDITGFGIVGHTREVAHHSKVDIMLHSAALPWLPGARRYAQEGCLPGGAGRNRFYLMDEGEPKVRFLRTIEDDIEDLLFDPETSGGLILSLPAERGQELAAAFQEANEPLWLIGEIQNGTGMVLVD